MKTKRNILLALAWPNPQLVHGVLNFARKRHWFIQMPESQDEEQCREWNGDGIICTLDPKLATPTTRAVLDKNVPTVDCAGLLAKPGLSMALVNHAETGEKAAEYYLDKGFHHLLFVCGAMHDASTEIMREGFYRPAAARNIVPQTLYLDELRGNGNILENLGERLHQMPHPLGVFCRMDIIAFTVLQACLRANIRVPYQVAILGVGNQELQCDWLEVPISRVRAYNERHGFEAAQLLEQILDGEAPPGSIIRVPPEGVVERASTDMLAIQDPLVRKALFFIQANLHRRFYVAEISDKIGVSRSTLERRFRATLNCSITEETNRRRIEEAKKLLLKQRIKIIDLSERLGFASPLYFYRIFHRLTGLTPRKFIAQKKPLTVNSF
jgi:LacI family transcriptional regulator